jgi:hypothetical protein
MVVNGFREYLSLKEVREVCVQATIDIALAGR